MKWIITVGVILICAVAFLYYLLTNEYFVPFNQVGEYNWLNIFVLLFLCTVIFASIIFLINMAIISVIKRELEIRKRMLFSIKIALFSSLILVMVFVLNFFHILDWIWGLGILAIAIILLFIILFPHDKKEESVQ
ncbi:MAG: hypothetical protein PHE21_02310 [Candidatus Dojkabacteria bacterium]|nr:hypothetical protein [Candidatus Dojkabacteria bacterium]